MNNIFINVSTFETDILKTYGFIRHGVSKQTAKGPLGKPRSRR